MSKHVCRMPHNILVISLEETNKHLHCTALHCPDPSLQSQSGSAWLARIRAAFFLKGFFSVFLGIFFLVPIGNVDLTREHLLHDSGSVAQCSRHWPLQAAQLCKLATCKCSPSFLPSFLAAFFPSFLPSLLPFFLPASHKQSKDSEQPQKQKATKANRSLRKSTQVTKSQQKPAKTNRSEQQLPEATKSHQKPTKATRSHENPTEANKSHQKPVKSHQKPAKATRS